MTKADFRKKCPAQNWAKSVQNDRNLGFSGIFSTESFDLSDFVYYDRQQYLAGTGGYCTQKIMRPKLGPFWTCLQIHS